MTLEIIGCSVLNKKGIELIPSIKITDIAVVKIEQQILPETHKSF